MTVRTPYRRAAMSLTCWVRRANEDSTVQEIPAEDLELALRVLTPRGFRGHRPPSAVSKISLNPFLTHDDIHALIDAGVRVSRFRISSGGETWRGRYWWWWAVAVGGGGEQWRVAGARVLAWACCC